MNNRKFNMLLEKSGQAGGILLAMAKLYAAGGSTEDAMDNDLDLSNEVLLNGVDTNKRELSELIKTLRNSCRWFLQQTERIEL